jgi:hypothetical protein
MILQAKLLAVVRRGLYCKPTRVSTAKATHAVKFEGE